MGFEAPGEITSVWVVVACYAPDGPDEVMSVWDNREDAYKERDRLTQTKRTYCIVTKLELNEEGK